MNKHNLFISSFKFLLKLVFLIIIMTIFFFKIISPQFLYIYNAALLDKMERLESISEPKIVLIGNSNLSFSVQSELLEEAFDMPVVNMGLHGGLGNAFHEEMAKINLHDGDIIVVSHTSFSDNDELEDPVLVWTTIENHPNLWKLIRTKDLPKLYFSFPDYAKKVLNAWGNKSGNQKTDESVYSRSAFNKYGDVAYTRLESLLTESDFDGLTYVPEINDICINRLNDLNQYITKHGATMVVAAYPIAYGPYTPPAEEYIAFQSELEGSLDCPVISDYTDYFFEYKYFYDGVPHMTNEGAVLRTNQLIADLQHYLQSQ